MGPFHSTKNVTPTLFTCQLLKMGSSHSKVEEGAASAVNIIICDTFFNNSPNWAHCNLYYEKWAPSKVPK
jgi:hypothetical protein